jgi:hypothetical protein
MQIHEFTGITSTVFSLAFSPDSRWIAGSDNKIVGIATLANSSALHYKAIQMLLNL